MRIIQQDWWHLIHEKKVLDSPNYLHHNGKPVIAIWGKLFTINWRTQSDPLSRA